MEKVVKKSTKTPRAKSKPASTPEAREEQMFALADELAEKKLRDGTASSQLILHYLNLGSTRGKLEKEILISEKQLKEAKTESLQVSRRLEELYTEAIEAMKLYGGNDN